MEGALIYKQNVYKVWLIDRFIFMGQEVEDKRAICYAVAHTAEEAKKHVRREIDKIVPNSPVKYNITNIQAIRDNTLPILIKERKPYHIVSSFVDNYKRIAMGPNLSLPVCKLCGGRPIEVQDGDVALLVCENNIDHCSHGVDMVRAEREWVSMNGHS